MTSTERVTLYRKRHPERRRETQLKSKYGITEDTWNLLLESQDFRCAICRTDEHQAKNWHTDHCHTTGIVRGILCSPCNKALGLFKENADILEAASNYVRNYI